MEGLRVPDDLAIVGFDDINQASQLSVPLTTVAQPREQIGQQACEILLGQMSGREEKPVQIVLPVQLIIRQSCGAKDC
jgi:DNA-binding LacI/PurR family transcriptional regulator